MLKQLHNNISIFGITKVRNEEKIIKDTLDFYSNYCNAIYVYDDYSTDKTLEILKLHPKVKGIIENKKWDKNRPRAEFEARQAILELAQKDKPDWFIYFDADERIEMPQIDLSLVDGIKMKLFDFYITEDDKNLDWKDRRWLGPEYREILMMFRNLKGIRYQYLDQREITMPRDSRIVTSGYVKHYGKAISIEEWDKTCEYYSKHWEEPYKSKWEARKGKAIHTKSDFGAELIAWEDKDLCGYPL